MRLFHCAFNVLGIVVSPPNDQQIFQPPRDKDFAVLHKSQVAGPQERPFASIVEKGTEGMRRFFNIVPIALRGTSSSQPNLTNLVCRTTRTRFRMDDDYFCIATWTPAADHLSNR